MRKKKLRLKGHLVSVLNKRHHLEALGNKYKDLCEFIPQRLDIMPLFRTNFKY